MKIKYIFLVIVSFASSTLYSQSTRSDIISEGGAKIKVTPDVALLTLKIEKTDTSERKSLQLLNFEITKVTNVLNEMGFPSNTIRVLDYGVSSETNNKNVKKYTAANTLKIEFPFDNNLVDVFFRKTQQTEFKDLEISLETKLSDSLENITRGKLIQLAVTDAKNKAQIIAKTLNLKLGNVRQVSKYATELISLEKLETVKFSSPKIVRDEENKYNTPFNKYQVEAVELEEKITIIFEIAN